MEKKIHEEISSQGNDFEKQKYTSSDITKLLKTMQKDINGNYLCSMNENDIVQFEQKIKQEKGYTDDEFEYISYINYNERGKTKSILSYIRNILAYGSFYINTNTKIYYLESEKIGKIRARIRLKEVTLLLWIKRIKNKKI